MSSAVRLAREADGVFYHPGGRGIEIGVASTKAFTRLKLVAVTLLALKPRP
jgi:glucosamine 6-phosphate synthetase-like amidotransferase/phosphosugar isomerase protein